MVVWKAVNYKNDTMVWLKDVALFILNLLDRLLVFVVAFVISFLATDNIGLSVILAFLLTYTYSISNKVRKLEKMLTTRTTSRKEPL